MKAYIGDVSGYFVVTIARMLFNFCVRNSLDTPGNHAHICCQCYVVFNWDVKFVRARKNLINSSDKGKAFPFCGWITILHNIPYANKIVIAHKRLPFQCSCFL